MNNFPWPFRSLWMFKYKEENVIYLQYSECNLLQKIQHEAKCRRSEFRWTHLHMVIWTTRKMHDFQEYFSRTLALISSTFQNQSGTLRSWNFKRKNPGLSRRRGNPADQHRSVRQARIADIFEQLNHLGMQPTTQFQSAFLPSLQIGQLKTVGWG